MEACWALTPVAPGARTDRAVLSRPVESWRDSTPEAQAARLPERGGSGLAQKRLLYLVPRR